MSSITRQRLRQIIHEVCGDAPRPHGRDLGYGEGEGRMAKSQLFKIARYSQSLHDMLEDKDDLPEWVLSKISVMASDIGKVKHYLEYKIHRLDHGEEEDAEDVLHSIADTLGVDYE